MDMERLVLLNVTESDSGLYTCVVTNKHGQIYHSAWLEVVTDQSVNATSSDSHLLFLAVMLPCGMIVAVAAVIITLCWRRHRPPKDRQIVMRESPLYFPLFTIPVDQQWEVNRNQ